MAAGPLLSIGFIASSGRGTPSVFTATEFGPKTHKHILAYVDPLRATARLLATPPKERRDLVLQAADTWLKATDKGELTSIRLSDFETQLGDTVLEDIHRSKVGLVSELNRLVASQKAKGDLSGAALTLTKVVRICEIGKFVDMNIVRHCSLLEIAALQQLEDLVPALDKATKSTCSSYLSSLSNGKLGLLDIVANGKRAHGAYLAKKGKSPLPIEFSQGYETLTMAVNVPERQNLDKLRSMATEASVLDLVKVSTISRLAIQTVQALDIKVAGLKLALSR